METRVMKKHIAIILALFTAIFFLAGCGSSEPAEKVYIEESEIDAALSDGDSYKGKYINISGKVFSIDKDGDTVAMQVWYDVENAEQQFIVYADKELASGVKEDSFVKVDGKITGTFTGENYFGGEITALMIEAESLEIGGYDDVYAPAESTKEVGETKEQHGVSVTLDRIEYAKGEARVYLSVKNDSGYQASIYAYDAKAIQDGKQFEHEDNYEAGDSNDIGDVLDGASKEGILRFKGLDPEKPVKIQIGAYSDNFDIEMEDFVFEVE
jgi:hypothetical protein